jgi:hypothetical protein
MTMHIIPGIYGINAKPKSKSNARQRNAKAVHDDWLRARGLHPEQIAKRQSRAQKVFDVVQDVIRSPKLPALSNKVGNGVKNDIWEKIRKGEEKPDTVAEIEAKSKRIAIPYSKGAYQYMGTGKENFKDAGKKNGS